MKDAKHNAHPYIPNSVWETKQFMLDEIGVKDVEELYRSIPEELRYRKKMNLPDPFHSEYELKQHVESILAKNKDCSTALSFLGGGCYQHHIPAVVDEVVSRGEFLTAYQGATYTDKGRFQVIFEYVSMLTDLLGMEVAGMPTFDSFSASGTGIRMAGRLTDRDEILVPSNICPQRLAYIEGYCKDIMNIVMVKADNSTGLIDLDDLEQKIKDNTGGLFIENPGYLGAIEYRWDRISSMVHGNGSLLVVSVNPMSLGLLEAPGNYGADIVTGDGQPLGVHMQCGGGATGFVAVRDDDLFINELPSLLWSIAPLKDGKDGFGFTYAVPTRLSYVAREDSVEFTGTATALWSTANAVYLALMGPRGMREIGETIIEKSHYAKKVLSEIEGVSIPIQTPHFNEFIVNFDGTGRTVSQINKALLAHDIFAGKDISAEFPEYGQSALYCISEIHSKADIDKLAHCLKEVTR
ncbi:MAG: aminomethyl-transferring glycine dehydrogenase subunit GcvPA [Proteobacteria bacterium]|nr:aminomethyl-transferring glycine dehydrogenase subunit GcvPA [Pseudomonadota bacterium]